MNNLYLNNNSPIDYTMGSNLVDSMYMGSTMVYSRGGGNPLPKDGVAYVYTKNDEYVLPGSLSINDADNVVGLYFGNSEHQILISLSGNSVSYLTQSTLSEKISGITTTVDVKQAEQDFNGLQNTIILNQYPDDYRNGDVTRAVNKCTAEFATDGRQGYLPGAGELYFLMQNITAINNAISVVSTKFANVNGKSIELINDEFYWSSTQQSAGQFWCCKKNLSGTTSFNTTNNVRSRTFFTPGKYECDWYGVRFDNHIPAGTRIGNLEMHKTLPIQSKMRGCTITAEGVIKYLNPNNWEKYEDGTDRDFSLNTMVEIPEYYCYVDNFISNGTTVSFTGAAICISENPNYGWYKFPKCYIGAYEGYVENTDLGLKVLKSIRTESIPDSYTQGYHPTVNTTRQQFQNYARSNGNSHWNMYTYEAHKAMTWLFVVEYANRNSQADFIEALTEEGYKRGGLGPGITTSTSLGNYNYNYCPCGYTDELGNNTGIRLLSGHQANRYRGIENPFGSLFKNVIDVYFQSSAMFQCKDYELFDQDNPLISAYEETCKVSTSSVYNTCLSKSSGVCGELCQSNNRSSSDSSTTYWCDYYYASSSSTARTLMLGGDSSDGSYAGLFRLGSYHGLGDSSAYVGTRLTYLI